MPHPRSFPATMAVLALGATHAGSAAEFTTHGTHEHGRALLQVALQAQTLQVELVVPALHVLGFEHAPRTASEKALAATAPARLRDLAAPVRTPAEAGCRRTSARLVEAADHDHDHDHEPGHEAHQDVQVRWTFRCDRPAALAWLEPAFLAALLQVTQLQVDAVLPGAQRSARVKLPTDRVTLR